MVVDPCRDIAALSPPLPSTLPASADCSWLLALAHLVPGSMALCIDQGEIKVEGLAVQVIHSMCPVALVPQAAAANLLQQQQETLSAVYSVKAKWLAVQMTKLMCAAAVTSQTVAANREISVLVRLVTQSKVNGLLFR